MELPTLPTLPVLLLVLLLGCLVGWCLHARRRAPTPAQPSANGHDECLARLDELAKTVARRRLTAQESAELKVLLALKAEFEA